jgi:peptidyl-Lys metalloendopeptidase
MQWLIVLTRASALSVALASIVLGSSHSMAAMKTLKSLHCELLQSASDSRVAGNAGQGFVLKLHNRGETAIWLLRRNTPLEPMLSDHLQVERNGKRLEYLGPVAKRAPPTIDEYLRLAPGERIEHAFEISREYEMSARGRYRIFWNGEFMDAHRGESAPNPENSTMHQVACKSLRFTR